MADRKISDLTALTTPATGDLIPIVDISEAAAADKNKSITVGELLRGAPDGTAAAPGIAFESDGGNGMFLGGTDILAFSTGGSQAVTIDASQRVGIGTTSPSQKLEVQGSAVLFGNGTSDVDVIMGISGYGSRLEYSTGKLYLRTNNNNRLTVDNTGNVGIGTTSPLSPLAVSNGSNKNIEFQPGSTCYLLAYDRTAGDYLDLDIEAENLIFSTNNGTERARIDSSGRLLVGTTSALTNDYWTSGQIQLANNNGAVIQTYTFSNSSSNGAAIELHKARGTQASPSNPSSGDTVGEINFYGYNSSAGTPFQRAAFIRCQLDGTPASGGDTTDMPGRLVFATSAEGSSNPTERFRIASAGWVQFYPASNVDAVNIAHPAAAGATYRYLYGAANGTNTFTVFNNGDVRNTNDSYGAISDIKLKENIVDAGSQWNDFKAVRFRKYNFKEETGHETFTQLGVIAQELETVCPGLVIETPDRDDDGNDLGTTTKSVKYSVLTKKALVALQEAMERIETLEAKVAALEGA